MSEWADHKFRAALLREAASAIVAENDRVMWATKPGKHWAADLLNGMAATSDAVVEQGALPMPVGSEPLALTEAQIEALAAAGNRVVNDMRHEDLCMCDAWPETCLSSGNFHMGDWDMSGLESALPAVLALWEQMRGAELERLRAQVAELLAERRTTNESLDDAVRELRTSYAERAQRETHPGRRQAWLLLARVEESERVAAALLTPEAARSADKLTVLLAPSDGEHYSVVHHDYRIPHDLPAAGAAEAAVKCRCEEPGADPYACEADDCSGEFSELNPFGGGTLPVEKASAEVSRKCGCGWRTSVWHVDDGSAEEELHGHVVRVHGGTYPAESGGERP